ncbi:YkgJ family cysteine cluster protein [Candidatus Woesearchaeota archaeon]|nr:YkgJ family cysteine cluster protein [Candidatus Woesearchaeota archaeon]
MITKQTPMEKILELASDCKQCGNCCKYGSGAFAPGQVEHAAKHFGMSEQRFKARYLEPIEMFNTTLWRPKFEKPFGECIFLKHGKCMIQDVKPLQCGLGNPCSKYSWELSEWFKLNFAVNSEDPASIRLWKIYLEDNNTIPGGQLHELVPDKQKLNYMLNYGELKYENSCSVMR